jgi:hypothetical protein
MVTVTCVPLETEQPYLKHFLFNAFVDISSDQDNGPLCIRPTKHCVALFGNQFSECIMKESVAHIKIINQLPPNLHSCKPDSGRVIIGAPPRPKLW